MLLEISRSKQILINNGYTNKEVDEEIRKFLKKEPVNNNTNTADSHTTNTQRNNSSNTTQTIHQVFYKNFMSHNYKKSEKSLRKVITSTVKVNNPSDTLQLVIYYKSSKTRNLIMRNNLTPKVRDLAKTHLIYDFDCNEGECTHLPIQKRRYSGLTTCTLSRRLLLHIQNGAIKKHFEEKHGRNITRQEIVDGTKARYYERELRRLEILESLIIRFEDPDINKQDTGKKRILKLFGTKVLTVSPPGQP